MARIELISGREGLSPDQEGLYDWIIESRGSLVRPFQVLLHAPGQADHLARLGHQVRFESVLDGADREFAILTTGLAHGCRYVWDTHFDIAVREGVRAEALAFLEGGEGDAEALQEREAAILEMVRELCFRSSVSTPVFDRVVSELGTDGVVELAVLVGYYTLLGFTMATFDVC